jgi:putative exosortase-associated protein (TIGR04073 family)
MAGPAMADDFIGGHIIASYERIVGPHPSPYFNAFKRLGTGFVNIGTAPIELIKQPITEAEKSDSIGEFLSGLTYGIFAGVSWTFYREVSGIYEVVTFYLPRLEPTIHPEYIF